MSSHGRGRGNPWNTRGGQHFNQKPRSDGPTEANIKSAQNRFQEARNRLQASVQKHINQDYESSSEEEELESENIFESVIKSYSLLGGTSEDLGRTQNFLEDVFQSNAATCLICIATVKRSDSIWSCEKCYCFFHVLCIQRWAKDSIVQQKTVLEERSGKNDSSLCWACPKCRQEYPQNEIPRRYYCFCGNKEDPEYHAWLVPHSCGETCNKPLQPICGHKCLLLCHPGPCPPCPKIVKSTCHCGKSAARPQRCSNKLWSCGQKCGHKLSCGRHSCAQPCHAGPCSPCPQYSTQTCMCGKETMIRECAHPTWQCQQVCGKVLDCERHKCEEICHKGECGVCPRSLPRHCPCGKSVFTLPCTEDVPTCGDTCGRVLDCGIHMCSQRCHKDKCGACLERTVKQCRCGLHKKEVPCQKDYLCETKCKHIRDCNRHPCNKKCCDGACGPCEKPCGRTLTCGNHKCTSICHRGQCYPCPLTVPVKCRCGSTFITVPCGCKKKTRPPRCSKSCQILPDCHHPKRENHRCHFGSCPPCRQVCGIKHECGHPCPKTCHSAVLIDVNDGLKPSGPWEKILPQYELRALPCGDCQHPVTVDCLGGHESSDVPCYRAKEYLCGRICGRTLACGNHSCSLPCHKVIDAVSQQESGSNCETCNGNCEFPRPEGCTHNCQKPCHRDPCPPCKVLLRIRCHCTLNQLFVHCHEWTSASDKERIKLQTCGNQCPKNYDCGHRCTHDCHAGPCPDAELCQRKVKIFCSCRRMKKDFSCKTVRSGQSILECDDMCKEKVESELKKRQKEEEEKKRQEEMKNKEELEKFEKKMQGRKKYRERRAIDNHKEPSFFVKYWIALLAGTSVVFAIIIMLLVK